MATTPPPLVIEDASLLQFIQYIIAEHSSLSTLIVCSSKDAFLDHLRIATEQELDQQAAMLDEAANQTSQTDQEPEPANPKKTFREQWDIPTLRLLSTSRTIKLAFCPDVTHLRAYLATYAIRKPLDGDDIRSAIQPGSILAILNPIDVHRPTSAFSAQGLNRTFSLAVEAAHNSKSRLLMAECELQPDVGPAEDFMTQGEGLLAPRAPLTSPWDEEVSILNVTTKSFGAGERGWVGRTVKLRTIAQRWCDFQTISFLTEE